MPIDFAIVHATITPKLVAFAMRRGANSADAEDLAADAVFDLWRSEQGHTSVSIRWNPACSIEDYLINHVKSQNKSRWHTKARRSKLIETFKVDAKALHQELGDDPAYLSLLAEARRVLATLPARPDADNKLVPEIIAAMFFLDTTSPSELAKFLRTTPAEARRALARARTRLAHLGMEPLHD